MFYGASMWFFLMILAEYANFRDGIYDYLRNNRVSRNNIRKSRKGFLNYWIYKKLNTVHPLGIIYKLNIVFLVTICLYALLMAFCWIDLLHLPIAIVSAVLCVLYFPCHVFACIENTKAYYGVPFVLFTTRRPKAPVTFYTYSTLINLLFYCIFPFILVVIFKGL